MPPLNSKRDHLSLPEVHGTIRTGQTTVLRRMLAFAGPGFLVAVGYMDPGNWATAIAGGSAFGYTLLSVVLLSNIMAVLLQALAVRMGIAGGRDLAQFCYEQFGKPARILLWLMAETAIIATDLAEVIGTAIALNLLFNMPLPLDVVLTALDVFLILWLQGKGFRSLEAVVITLTLVITACFIVEIAYSDPVWGDVMRGFIPQKSVLGDPTILYLALGIIGATVMPYNLYLHSSIVQTRAIGPSIPEKRQAIRYATLDSTFALTFALFINAAILILAAAAFYTTGQTNVAAIQEAFHLLDPTLGTTLAATLFAVALLASGLNSTVTATLTGQIVMEGFIRFQLKPWVRRLVTRGIAIVPAVIVSVIYGESGTAELLVLS